MPRGGVLSAGIKHKENYYGTENFYNHNKMGLHMRPANTFVTETSISSEVDIVFGGKRINGKSIMNIMAGCIKCGSEITVECSGADENEMLKKAEELIIGLRRRIILPRLNERVGLMLKGFLAHLKASKLARPLL